MIIMNLSDDHKSLLIISVAFWTIVGTLCKWRNISFADATVSNLHSIVGCFLALTTLYVSDETKLKEMYLLCWTQGYFIVDLIYCLWVKDVPFTFHAISSLSLSIFNSSGILYALRANSKGFLCELSSPFYQKWLETKSKKHFQRFCLAFFVVRIIYLPIFLYSCREGLTTTVAIISLGFYLLNVMWFLKGLKMLLNYNEKLKSV